MTSTIESIFERAMRQALERQIEEQERELERFAIAGCMLYPNHHQDISIAVQFDGLLHTWWIR